METAFLTAALGGVIGAILAATGAGGGILAVPMLVFGLHLGVAQAAPMGLIAVGMSAAVGAGLGLRDGIVRYRAAALIGVLGMAVAPLGVALAGWLPNPPLMTAFALVLALNAWRTLRKAGTVAPGSGRPPCVLHPQRGRLLWTRPCARALAAIGALSGLLSGLLGVGGGFVIVPALGRYTDLPARSILATSLAVIALVSAGAITAAAARGRVDWGMALPFALGAVVAMLTGRRFVAAAPPARLQRLFALVSLAAAALMLWRAFTGAA
jgi:uncharacterized membrane protein YfcA